MQKCQIDVSSTSIRRLCYVKLEKYSWEAIDAAINNMSCHLVKLEKGGVISVNFFVSTTLYHLLSVKYYKFSIKSKCILGDIIIIIICFHHCHLHVSGDNEPHCNTIPETATG